MHRKLILILLLVSISRPAFSKEKVPSVCELLTHLDRYSGKMIIVRSLVRSSLDTWLAAEEDCATRINVEGERFENLVAIAWPDSLKNDRPRVGFSTDQSSSESLRKALRERDPQTQKLYVEVEGFFYTLKPPQKLVVRLPGGPVKVGFGHLGMAPAEIIVKTISNISIVRR